MAYVYSHHKLDSGEVFYIGIGKSDNNKFKRAYDSQKRKPIWKRTADKYGHYVMILKTLITWEQAMELEIELIKRFGRINTGTGTLVNLTDGGEGNKGFVATPEYRAKLSKALKGISKGVGENNHFFGKTHTKEVRQRISTALKATDKNKGANNHNYGKPMPDWQKKLISKNNTGRKHTPETKAKIRAWGKGKPKSDEWKAKVSGENNHWYQKGYLKAGEKSNSAKKCIFIETGETFGCLKTACYEKGLSYHTQRIYLSPTHPRHKNRKFNFIN